MISSWYSSVYPPWELANMAHACFFNSTHRDHFLTSGDCLFQLRPREKEALNYADKLKDKFSQHPEVKRIARHRHVPKLIYNASKELRTIRNAQKKKYVLLLMHMQFCYSVQFIFV